jgi:colicin import membrane protein
MRLRSRLAWLVLAGAAVSVLGGGCKGSGASVDESGKPVPLSSVASSAPRDPNDTMNAEAFRATMRHGAHAEKTDRAQAAELYTETLARTDLSKEQRATVQYRLGRLRLAEGKRDEARALASQALVLRPGWGDAQALLEKIDAPAGAAAGDGAEPRKAARAKKDSDAAAAKAKAAEEAKRSDAEMAKAKKSGVAGTSDADAAKAREKQAAVSAKSAETDAAAAARKKHRSDLADRLRALEIERDLLRSRMKELESQLAALREDSGAKR